MDENKEVFCRKLGELIGNFTRNFDIQKIEYKKVTDELDRFEELAVIRFIRWMDAHRASTKAVRITGDSCLAIMHDVYKALT